jgi:hypothetical protein
VNVQDVVTRIRRTFGDEAAVQVTNDDVIRWINDGQIEIVKSNESALQKTDFVNLVAGTSQYNLPADLFMLRSMRYKFSSMLSFSALKYVNMQQFDETVDGWDGTAYSSGSPLYFTMYEGKVVLFPTPNQSMVAGLKVLYNQKPTDVVNLGDSLALPLIYHNTIVRYCLWQAGLLDEDNESAMMYRNDFQSDTNTLNNRENADPNATYPVITVREFDQ